jgi:opacity protein-like surface antigen
MKRTLVLAALAAAVATAPAAAQAVDPVQSNTSGVLLGIGLNASTIHADDETLGSGKVGGGIFLQLGYGFGSHFALYSELSAAAIDDKRGGEDWGDPRLGLAHFDLGARIHFGGERSKVRPFLQAAVGARAVTRANVPDIDDNGDMVYEDYAISGGSATVGVGVDYFFTPVLALHTSAQVSGGKFTRQTLGDRTLDNLDVSSTTGRVNLGVNWFPSRPRR